MKFSLGLDGISHDSNRRSEVGASIHTDASTLITVNTIRQKKVKSIVLYIIIANGYSLYF